MKNIAENKTQMALLGIFAISLVGFIVSTSKSNKYRGFFGATDTNQFDSEFDANINPYIPYESF
jgi:hypothetical protein